MSYGILNDPNGLVHRRKSSSNLISSGRWIIRAVRTLGHQNQTQIPGNNDYEIGTLLEG